MKIDLEHEYQEYLKLTGLDESKMIPVQAQETKRAFYGGCARLFVLMNRFSNETEEEEGVECIISISKQIGDFWTKETEK